MGDLFDGVPVEPPRGPRIKDMLPGWVLVEGKNYLQSACGRMRIFRSQPSELTIGQRYSVYVRLAGEWSPLRTLALEIEPAAELARRVLDELAPVGEG